MISASLSLEYFAFITFDNATTSASSDFGNFILDVIASQDFLNETDQLSSEINKLNELQKSGVLTQEEFEKAKKKFLDN